MIPWGLLGAGVLLVWSAITGRSPVNVVESVLTGKPFPERKSLLTEINSGSIFGIPIGPASSSASPGDDRRQNVANVALQQLGKPYQWGAEGPDRFDCSGLTQYSYLHGMGITLPRTAALQAGKIVKYGAGGHPTNGDLVFLGVPAHHVGIYYNGSYINAPDVGQVVKVSPIPRGAYIGYVIT
jgi:cell wall-associated NlpC family hydrolase